MTVPPYVLYSIVWLLTNNSIAQCKEPEHFYYYLCRPAKGGGRRSAMKSQV